MSDVYDPTTPVPPAFEETWTQDHRGQYRRLLFGPRQAHVFLEHLEGGLPLSVDIETMGLGELAWKPKVVGTATTEMAWGADPRDPESLRWLHRVFRAARTIVFHNSPYDVPPLVNLGIMPTDEVAKVWDTLVLARMAFPDTLVPKGLDALAVNFLGAPKLPADELRKITAAKHAAVGARTKAEYFAKADISSRSYLMGNLDDALTAAHLFRPLYESAISRLTQGHPFTDMGITTREEAQRIIHREQVVNRTMLARSAKGLRVDEEFLHTYRSSVEAEQITRAAALEELGIKPGNGGELTAWLDEQGFLPAAYPRTPKTGKPSAKADDLEELAHPIAKTFVEWKQTDKVGGYLEKVAAMAAVTGRVHPQVSILGASATGRMAYSDPPLQQFPGGARGIILSDEGDELTSIDWTSVEPCVSACLSRDLGLAQFYEGGGDIYQPIVEMAKVTRKVAKVVVLALLYGEGIRALAASLGVSQDEARRIKSAVMAAMPGVARFIDQVKGVADRYGIVPTMSGRVLSVPSLNGQVAAYKGVNYVVQGSAYDVMAETVYRVHEAGLADAVYLAMHDELVVSTSAAEDVRRIMQTPPEAMHRWAGRTTTLRTDRADLGVRWAAA